MSSFLSQILIIFVTDVQDNGFEPLAPTWKDGMLPLTPILQLTDRRKASQPRIFFNLT